MGFGGNARIRCLFSTDAVLSLIVGLLFDFLRSAFRRCVEPSAVGSASCTYVAAIFSTFQGLFAPFGRLRNELNADFCSLRELLPGSACFGPFAGLPSTATYLVVVGYRPQPSAAKCITTG